MKANPSAMLRNIHKRALYTALQASGGDVEDAARALGIASEQLVTLLDGDPAAMWMERASTGISGMQRKVEAPANAQDADDEDESGNGSAW